MPHPFKLLFPILLTFFTASAVTARQQQPHYSPTSLPTRLKLDANSGGGEGSNKCWDSLSQLQSCTNEVVLFFLNGETYLGPSCCDAIRTIEDQCWPAMLGSIGFTAEEGGILRGYCDAAGFVSTLPPPNYGGGASVNTSVGSNP
ncbi:hypothetical protein RHSIM_Rhsim10G0143700 [Rhododendron simsii]|uniref:Prolamin-like domain-containing protein n=1 Tax=Rhododendron simsii TaxID=118357 RepID=A0A834L9L2_RHOSS|nr:hypothetical protein RHSIM_Rhsim10G0143700 [Rhododendron simsii]